MKALDIFTPAGVPTVTYIERGSRQLEDQLRNSLKTRGMITSLSGPSKSGKTVLIHKVIEANDLITVSGGAIKSAEQLWDRVLNWMEAPSAYSVTSDHAFGVKVGAEAGGAANLLVVKGEAKGTAEASYE